MVGVNEEKSVFFLTRAGNFSALMVSRAALCEIIKGRDRAPRINGFLTGLLVYSYMNTGTNNA